MLLRAVPRADHGFQPFPVTRIKRLRLFLIWPDSHIREPHGIFRQRLAPLAHRSAGRSVGLVIGSRASAGAFCRALLTAESTSKSLWLPARLRACSQDPTRRAEERRAKRAAKMPPASSPPDEVGAMPTWHRNSLGVGRVARRARPDTKPFSRPLPRLTLKAGHKEGLPTTTIIARYAPAFALMDAFII